VTGSASAAHSAKMCIRDSDNIVTVPTSALGRQIGYLLPAQETSLTAAIHAAFDLD